MKFCICILSICLDYSKELGLLLSLNRIMLLWMFHLMIRICPGFVCNSKQHVTLQNHHLMIGLLDILTFKLSISK